MPRVALADTTVRHIDSHDQSDAGVERVTAEN